MRGITTSPEAAAANVARLKEHNRRLDIKAKCERCKHERQAGIAVNCAKHYGPVDTWVTSEGN